MAWEIEQEWHSLSTDRIIALFESDGHKGLSIEESERRLRSIGPNVITPRGAPSAFIRFLQQFNHPLIYVLLVAGITTFFLPGHLVDAGVIFLVIFVNSIIGFVQESQAKAAIEALSKLVRVETSVIREERVQRVDASVLVPGDLVLLQSGDRVPADLRLLRVRDLSLDESMLTGESLPVAKELKVLPAEFSLPDRKNMAYSGTMVSMGQGAGIVVATGGLTELGHISHLVESAEEMTTPLTKKLGRFSLVLTWVILALASLTFGAGMLHKTPVELTFIAAVALAVGAIPEGLPAVVTIIMAIGVTRMAKRNAVVRKLPAVETLGSTTVICSDKTGTLTKNEMTVTVILTGDSRYEVTGGGYRPEGSIREKGKSISCEDSRALSEIMKAGILCNDAHLGEHDGIWRIEGDPTEGALLVAGIKAGLDPGLIRDEGETLDAIPFESERQYMATLHGIPEKGRVIYLKGAVERVLSMCDVKLDKEGKNSPFDRDQANGVAEDLAKEGLRVLAFAFRLARTDQTTLHPRDVETGMIFLGLQGMIDPPRPEAVAAVKACQNAGILVKMITGDHALTALTIARQMGLGNEHAMVIQGDELAKLSDQELSEIALRADVFARVIPEQKLRLVKALQARGAVVAMTGDGVNDAPALKQADIGIAMGQTGTEVAKDAADMVLTDDNFASIEAAVEEGRGVYDNLRKFITWTLPTNGGEGLLLVIAIAAGLVLPILPVQLLWINMTTSVALGTVLAFEPKEAGLMRPPARDPNEPILTGELLGRIVVVSVLMVIGAFSLYFWELSRGVDLASVRTVVCNVVVFVEIAYLFNCRSLVRPVWEVGLFSNLWALCGVLIMVALQLAFVYLPPMQRLFQTSAVPLESWLDVAVVVLVVYLFVETEKWVRRKSFFRKARD